MGHTRSAPQHVGLVRTPVFGETCSPLRWSIRELTLFVRVCALSVYDRGEMPKIGLLGTRGLGLIH